MNEEKLIHDLNNQLVIALGNAEFLVKNQDLPENMRPRIESLLQTLLKMRKSIRDYRRLSLKP